MKSTTLRVRYCRRTKKEVLTGNWRFYSINRYEPAGPRSF
jgi:hypothetical protein